MARAVRDLVLGEDGAYAPWPFTMHHECQTYGQFPRAGGWLDQDDREMYLMRVAATAERVYGKTQVEGARLSPEDGEFIAWVETDD